jgi:hypothetical protein
MLTTKNANLMTIGHIASFIILKNVLITYSIMQFQ